MLTICGLSTTATVMVVDLPPAAAALVAGAAAPDVAPAAAAADVAAAADDGVALLPLLDPHADNTIEPTDKAASSRAVRTRLLLPGTCTVSSSESHQQLGKPE
ncbi:hypothetical protein acdb102_03170 [Acidothermaceae bacterium B102]|nr:hypothetical protein acdb102_03170 [Acidothermaceae bacterium B102]